MTQNDNIPLSDYANPLVLKDTVSLSEYFDTPKNPYHSSKRNAFCTGFLYPLCGEKHII